MTIQKFQLEVFKIAEANHDLRLGQIYFNLCYKYWPEFANKITATNCDPFYTNNNIERFTQVLELYLQSEEVKC